ncbi:MAG: hypothetical protein QOH72_2717 [Solirubrobacteraceae bacterium]|jgi:uncharacterized membrane protein|nr:hypothetical protein [Solirubrobacteraceae bacterium]
MAYDAPGEERFTRQEAPRDRDRDSGPGPRGVRVRERNHAWYWLFLIPFVFTLVPTLYNKRTPELIGMPFFYWYQLAWVPITVIITVLVYRKTKGA